MYTYYINISNLGNPNFPIQIINIIAMNKNQIIFAAFVQVQIYMRNSNKKYKRNFFLYDLSHHPMEWGVWMLLNTKMTKMSPTPRKQHRNLAARRDLHWRS